MPLINLGSGLPVYSPGLTRVGQSQGVLQGVPAVTLQVWLTNAMLAYEQLMSGAKIVSVSYGQGDGSKSVTYSMASKVNLESWIGQLQRALGLPYQRRVPMKPYFR